MRDSPGSPNHIDRTVARNLVGYPDIPALGIFSVGAVQEISADNGIDLAEGVFE